MPVKPLSVPFIEARIREARSGQMEALQQDHRDGKGLFLRVFSTGLAVWYLDYRTRDTRERRRLKLGEYPEVGLKEARDSAEDTRSAVRKDNADPVGKARADRLKPKPGTVAEMFEAFFASPSEVKRQRERPRSAALDRGTYERYVKPQLGAMAAEDLTTDDVQRLVDDVASGRLNKRKKKGEPLTSAPRAVRTLLSRCCKWGARKRRIGKNRAKGVEVEKPQARRRVLSEDELRLLWEHLDILRDTGSPLSAAALRITLLTGQRPGEVLGMAWREVVSPVGKGECWIIPAAKAKSDRDHLVPLTSHVLRELEALKLLTGSKLHVFDSPNRPGRPIRSVKTAVLRLRVRMARAAIGDADAAELAEQRGVEVATVQKVLAQGRMSKGTRNDKLAGKVENRRELVAILEQLAGVSRWTPHDLRRSATTHMRGAGVSRFVAARVLGHADREVTADYDLYDNLKEKRSALETWQRHLEQIVTGKATAGGEVVSIDSRR